ncbi:MAG: toxin-antitoxin system HicB family antitoxin [Clostridiales bacterium]
MPSKKSFPLRVDGELFLAVENWANDELRSVNGQIEYLLREALKKQGRLPKPKSTAQKASAENSVKDQ